MNSNLYIRISAWQEEALKKLSKSSGMNMSKVGRFAVDYMLLNYKGPLNSAMAEEIDFLARIRQKKASTAAR